MQQASFDSNRVGQETNGSVKMPMRDTRCSAHSSHLTTTAPTITILSLGEVDSTTVVRLLDEW